jgi:hypothetical protein
MRFILFIGLAACFAATGADAERATSVEQSAVPSGTAVRSAAHATSARNTLRDAGRATPADTVDSLKAFRRATVLDTLGRARAAVAPKGGGGCGPVSKSPSAERSRLFTRTICHPAFRDAGSALDSLWPVKGPEPLPGSILPAKRIVAFYGNPLSKGMGILGATPPEEMLRRFDAEVAAWNRIDPAHPVQPALHMIVLVANALPGKNNLYRTRHDSAVIERVYGWAKSRKALLFLDLQVGKSTLEHELPWVEKFLIRPDVHLGIDPEFSMKKGGVPGQRVGTYDAADINYASHYLAGLVDKYKLPPKVLVVHRFTPEGVTNAKKVELDPRVQIVMDMDGFGAPWVKRDTYWRDIKREPVQFTGWKQFTRKRNDNPPTPRGDILRLWPVPLYIQLQ